MRDFPVVDDFAGLCDDAEAGDETIDERPVVEVECAEEACLEALEAEAAEEAGEVPEACREDEAFFEAAIDEPPAFWVDESVELMFEPTLL